MRSAVYTRVSTTEQALEGLSLAMQEKACREAALAAGATSVELFCDDGYTGTNEDRPAFATLMARLQEFDALYVWKLDRLSRSPFSWKKLLVRFEEAGTGFKSVTEAIDLSTPLGRAMLRIMGVFAGLFVENLKENVRAALAHRATVKGLPTCRPAFGYTYPGDDHPWEMEEDEAGVVRQIFRRYADGWILQDLTRWLNDEEIPRKHGGEHWWPRTVWQMLHNPVYIGQFRQRGEVIDAEHPPLINADLWHLVQARLALNAEIHPKGRKSQSLGPILHCGYCGSRLCLSAHHRKGSGTLGRYSCHTRLVLPPDQRHAAVGVTAPKAAAAVWAYVEWLFREDVLLQASERHVKHMAARQESGAGAQTRKRVEEIDRALAKSLRAFQVGAIDEDLLARENKGLLEEKKGLKRSLDEAQTPPAYREILERLSGLSAEQAITELRKASADRQLAVLGLLFEKVEVFPGYLVFHHRGGLLPLATVPLPKLYAPKRGLTEIVIPPDPYATTWTFTIPD